MPLHTHTHQSNKFGQTSTVFQKIEKRLKSKRTISHTANGAKTDCLFFFRL